MKSKLKERKKDPEDSKMKGSTDSAGKRSGGSCLSYPEPAKEVGQRQGSPGLATNKEKAVQRKVFQLWRRSPPEGLQGVEGNTTKTPLLGKLATQTFLPIQTRDRDDDFYFVADTTLEGDGARESH